MMVTDETAKVFQLSHESIQDPFDRELPDLTASPGANKMQFEFVDNENVDSRKLSTIKMSTLRKCRFVHRFTC